MYQGSPTPDEGGIFRRHDFRYFEFADPETVLLRQPDGSKRRVGVGWCAKVTYADLAVSESETADYTVATQFLVTRERDLLVAEVSRARIPGPDQAEFLAAHYAGTLKVEAIGYQAALVQQLRLRGLPVAPVHPDKDKVTRAAAAGALFRAGEVYHRAGASWLADFERELLAFPAGEHDDQVDTVSYAARDLPNLAPPVRRPRGRGRTIVGPIMTQEF